MRTAASTPWCSAAILAEGRSACAARSLRGEELAIAFLALAGALLGEHPLGKIFDDAQPRAAAAEVQIERRDLHRNDFAGLLAVALDPAAIVRRIVGRFFQIVDVFLRPDLHRRKR